VTIVVELGPHDGAEPQVAFRWDPDTDILSAQLQRPPSSTGSTGSVELEGADGSWIILDLEDERLHGIEIAVWPEVNKRSALTPPAQARPAAIRVPARSAGEVTSVEVDTPVYAETDQAERNFHFRLGGPRECTAVRVGRDLLLEVDATNHVAGLWLLNVPPFPDEP
jgi:hypothetical protein